MINEWHLDEDDWWSRPRRSNDPAIPDGNAHFGFTTEELPHDDKVYVRSTAYALAYDRGEIIPFDKRYF